MQESTILPEIPNANTFNKAHVLPMTMQICSNRQSNVLPEIPNANTYNKAHVGKYTEFNAYTVAILITKLFDTLHSDPT